MPIETDNVRRPASTWPSLLLFLVIVMGVGLAIGMVFTPGEWYQTIVKPSFNPPNWVFAPVWTTLYVMIAIAGWRIYQRAPDSPAMKLWLSQMVLNWAWSPVWFGLHWPWAAFAILVLMWLAIAGFIVASLREGEKLAAWLFAPYLAWVSFAGLLNFSIAILN